jgi:hypothetical protein
MRGALQRVVHPRRDLAILFEHALVHQASLGSASASLRCARTVRQTAGQELVGDHAQRVEVRGG